jgi:hypothetical protein
MASKTMLAQNGTYIAIEFKPIFGHPTILRTHNDMGANCQADVK